MRKTNCFIAGICLLFSFCMTSCEMKPEDVKQEEKINTENAVKPEQEAEQETDLMAQIEAAAYGCKIGSEGEDVVQGSITYRVNEVTVTKTKGSWIDILNDNLTLDESGAIQEDKTYVVVNVTVVRTDDEKEFWWNSIWLDLYTDNQPGLGAHELNSVSSVIENDVTNNDIYKTDIAVGETVTTDLIYVLDDAELCTGNHFLLEYNAAGAGHEFITPEDYSMIFLQTVEDYIYGQDS